MFPPCFSYIIELDDGKILTGKPDQFDGKNHKTHGFPVDFPLNQSIFLIVSGYFRQLPVEKMQDLMPWSWNMPICWSPMSSETTDGPRFMAEQHGGKNYGGI